MRVLKSDSEELKHGSALLIDLASLDALLAAFERITGRSREGLAFYKSRIRTADEHTTQLFEILSNLICFDRFLIDQRALNTYHGSSKLVDLLERTGLGSHFCGVYFPRDTYLSAELAVDRLRDAIVEKAPKRLLKAKDGFLEDIFGGRTIGRIEDGILKDMYNDQHLVERPDFIDPIPSTLGTTGMSVERLFVYLEVARLFDVPASLARKKYKALEVIGNKSRTVASAIKKEIEEQDAGNRTGLKELQDIVVKNALPKVTLSAPPLPSYLLQFAQKRNCSILDAVKLIRDDPAATAFREYVWENRKAFDPAFAGDHLKQRELQKKLSELGKQIANYNSSTGAFKKMREITIRTSNILLLGYLLKMVDVDLDGTFGKLRLNKGVLKISTTTKRVPPPYEVFIASWFE